MKLELDYKLQMVTSMCGFADISISPRELFRSGTIIGREVEPFRREPFIFWELVIVPALKAQLYIEIKLEQHVVLFFAPDFLQIRFTTLYCSGGLTLSV